MKIEFDAPQRVYRGKATLTGEVHIEAGEAPGGPEELCIKCRWVSHRTERPAGGGFAGRIDLREQSAEAEQPQVYPFEFELPNGPISFEGHLFGVHWLIEARAEFEDGTSLDTREYFRLEAPAPDDTDYVPGDVNERRPIDPFEEASPDSVGCGITLAGLPLLLGIAALWIAFADDPFSDELMVLLGGLFLTGVGGWMMWIAVQNALARRVLGPVEIRLSTYEARLGEELHCKIEVDTSARERINEALVWLKLEERKRLGRSASTGTAVDHHHTAYERYTTAVVDEANSTDERLVLAATVPIPEAAAPTLYGYRVEALWSVRVDIDVDGGAGWTQEAGLEVFPQNH